MSKVYLLQWYVNAYDQEGAVTLAVLKDKPTFHSIKRVIEEGQLDVESYLPMDAVYGMLARMECVKQDPMGGHEYVIEEWELL